MRNVPQKRNDLKVEKNYGKLQSFDKNVLLKAKTKLRKTKFRIERVQNLSTSETKEFQFIVELNALHDGNVKKVQPKMGLITYFTHQL